MKEQVKQFQQMVESRDKVPFNIDQIITAQLDEPAQAQRNCIYRVTQRGEKLTDKLNGPEKNKFTQIRVKSIDFMDKSATALYFYDMTHHVDSLRLESQVLESKSKNAALVNNQMTISHEFRTPLSTSLMFLESLLVEKLSPSGQKLIKLVTM